MKLPTNNSRNFHFFDSQSTVNSQQSTIIPVQPESILLLISPLQLKTAI
ncbi:hypothetical protein [Microcoleus sp.]